MKNDSTLTAGLNKHTNSTAKLTRYQTSSTHSRGSTNVSLNIKTATVVSAHEQPVEIAGKRKLGFIQ